MPGKRKAEANTKDDEKKKNKAETDWDSVDFSSNAKTGEKKVISLFSSPSTVLINHFRTGI